MVPSQFVRVVEYLAEEIGETAAYRTLHPYPLYRSTNCLGSMVQGCGIVAWYMRLHNQASASFG